MPATTIDNDIVVNQGATFELLVQVLDTDRNPLDLTGFLGRGQIKDTFGGTVDASFTVTITDAVNGKVTATLTP
ncbi:MAG TPA: hypothetical protein ENJ16_04670, partial [Planctomycetaceae bacterium]|nr:hypothetical protein [Planctomycetaceae bacterium]